MLSFDLLIADSSKSSGIIVVGIIIGAGVLIGLTLIVLVGYFIPHWCRRSRSSHSRVAITRHTPQVVTTMKTTKYQQLTSPAAAKSSDTGYQSCPAAVTETVTVEN